MKRALPTLLLGFAAAGLAVGQTPPRDSMRGVKRGEKPPSLPTLIVGINAAVGTIAEPGWPLIVSVAPSADGPATPPAMPTELEIRIATENGAPVALRFEALPPPATPPVEPGRYWVAPGAATAQLTPGRYRVTVVSPSGVPPGWSVEAGEIRVLSPAPERKPRLSLLEIHHALLRGRIDDALAEANRATGSNPRDAPAWVAKGDVLMQKDDPDGALAAYERALNLHRGDKVQPYPILRRRHAAHQRALEKRGVVAP
jgi:hypothetical protein